MRSAKPILLVEDDLVDVMIMKRALGQLRVTNALALARDGAEALEWLRRPDQDLPCLILLDINMPRMNGIEFLELLRQDPQLGLVPVVILTSSSEERDRIASYRLGVAGYMIKPVDYDAFLETVHTIDLYWTLSVLPYGD